MKIKRLELSTYEYNIAVFEGRIELCSVRKSIIRLSNERLSGDLPDLVILGRDLVGPFCHSLFLSDCDSKNPIRERDNCDGKETVYRIHRGSEASGA